MGKSDSVPCPYCEDSKDARGLVAHVRMSKDEEHGPQGELPDDAQDRVEEAIADAHDREDVLFVNFNDVEVDEPEDGDAPERCPQCDADEVYTLEEDEPIEFGGRVIAHGNDGDVICLECGELIDVEMPDE